MKGKKVLKGAVAVGVYVRKDKSLDKYSDKVLFPEKLKAANKIVAGLKLS